MTLADLLERVAAFAPSKPAIRFEGAVLTYAALTARVERAARVLAHRLGVGPGDRVAVLALNHPDTLVLLHACARLGAMLVPLNWRLAVPELRFILADAEVRALVLEEAFAGVLAGAPPASRVVGLDARLGDGPAWAELMAQEPAPVAPRADLRDPLLVVYTSGTTGRPKGAVLAQEALVWNGAMSAHMHALTSDDHVLTVLPFFHVGGLNIQTVPALHHGATVTLHRRFAPQATLDAIAQDRPTLTVLVPTILGALVEAPGWAEADLAGLRAVTTGSTDVPQDLVDAFEARGVPVLQVYGATETGPIAVYTRLGGDRTRRGSTGLPGLHCALRIVDEAGRDAPPGTSGEILVRGGAVFQGYWRDGAATAEALEDGWFRTGDVGVRDADGYLTVHDRRKNVVISGGENVYPAEVERALLAHPAVAQAAVVGRSDPRWGEVPVAHVVRRAGAACTEAELIGHVAAELARFKVPRAIRFVESLPRSALGKVQHHLVRAADDGAARSGG